MSVQQHLIDVLAQGPLTMAQLQQNLRLKMGRGSSIDLLKSLLDDPRFRRLEGERWCLAEHVPEAPLPESVQHPVSLFRLPELWAGPFAVVDVETTGLDPETAKVIQVAAIFFEQGKPVRALNRYLHPGPEGVPEHLWPVLGFDREPLLRQMVEQAPPPEEVLPDLACLNGLPWVAHNARFDRACLEGLGLNTPFHFDTIELAGLIFPLAASLKEGDVAAELGLYPEDIDEVSELAPALARLDGPRQYGRYHNALTDTLMLAWMLLRLNERLPQPFQQALAGADLPQCFDAWLSQHCQAPAGRLAMPVASSPQSAQAALHAYHSYQGREPRQAQDQMLEAVDEALQQGLSTAIEAPTGTGKTLAYLFPALVHALNHGEQVAICTYTKNLQDQLADELESLQSVGQIPVQYAVLKGRGNYLCLQTLAEALQHPPQSQEEHYALLCWLAFAGATPDGLLEGGPPWALIKRYPTIARFRSQLAARSNCQGEGHSGCWKVETEARVAGAQLLIMNHSLWLARHSKLETVKAVIVDEAHELEAAATASGTQELQESSLRENLLRLYHPDEHSGLLANLPQAKRLRQLLRQLLLQEIPRFGRILQELVERLRLPRLPGGSQQLEIPPYPMKVFGSRWQPIQQARTNLIETLLQPLVRDLKQLTSQLDPAQAEPLQELCQSIEGAGKILDSVLQPGFRNRVHQLNLSESGWKLSSVPVDVSRLLREAFAGRTTLLTSATLDLDDNMYYTLDRIGLGFIPTPRRLCLPPVLPYASRAAFAIARPMVYAPTPQTQQSYTSELAQIWFRLLTLSRGRALLLFTSRRRMQDTVTRLRQETLPWNLLVQNEESPRALLHRFRTDVHSVLAGLRQYWQGVDVPGEALSLVCMEKLPFAVFQDPLVAARARLVERQGRNAFEHFLLPEMLLAFKQGFGRLLRDKADSGAVIVFDRRLAFKSYLPRLLRVLPGYLPRDPQTELSWPSLVADLGAKVPGLFDQAPTHDWLPDRMPTLNIPCLSLPAPDAQVQPVLEQALAAFGFTTFRSPEQKSITWSQLRHQAVLGILPTGAGKSLTFQLTAMIGEGLTLVISPLVALIKDQIEGLGSRGFEWAGGLFSGQDGNTRRDLLARVRSGVVKLLYVAPERLRDPLLLQLLSEIKVRALVVDEAHCLYAWGPHFRPDFLYLHTLREQIGQVPITALTATAPPARRGEILAALGLPAETPQIVASFARPELRYRVYGPHSPLHPITGPQSRLRLLLRILTAARAESASAIVYVNTTSQAELLASQLQLAGFEARAYHGAMETPLRHEVQDLFMEDQIRTIVCTKAFGMGIDKAGIRYVIHHDTPGDLAAYAQEAGRAGRSLTSGEVAWCILMYSPRDEWIHRFFIARQLPDQDDLQKLAQDLLYCLKPAEGLSSEENSPREEAEIPPDLPDIPPFGPADQLYYLVLPALQRLGEDWDETRLRVNLHRLQELGWLTRSADVFSQGQAWRWQGTAPESPLLAALAEGPPPQDSAPMSFAALAQSLELTLPDLCRELSVEATAGRIGLQVWERALHLRLDPRLLAGELPELPAVWLARINENLSRGWQEMKAWAESKATCRVAALMRYLGEPGEPAACGHCEICAPTLDTPWAEIADHEVPRPHQQLEAAGILLEAIFWNQERGQPGSEGGHPLGLNKLLALLVANEYYLTTYDNLPRMRRLSYYGWFRSFPNREQGLRSLLDRLVKAGYCTVSERHFETKSQGDNDREQGKQVLIEVSGNGLPVSVKTRDSQPLPETHNRLPLTQGYQTPRLTEKGEACIRSGAYVVLEEPPEPEETNEQTA